MKKGDKVKHRNVFIEGEVVQVDKPEIRGEKPVVHVQCDGGLYYDQSDNWELLKDEAVGKEVLQVDSVEEV